MFFECFIGIEIWTEYFAYVHYLEMCLYFMVMSIIGGCNTTDPWIIGLGSWHLLPTAENSGITQFSQNLTTVLLSHPQIQPTLDEKQYFPSEVGNKKILFSIPNWFNLWMRNLGIWRANFIHQKKYKWTHIVQTHFVQGCAVEVYIVLKCNCIILKDTYSCMEVKAVKPRL